MIDQWWNGFTPPEISVVEPDEGPSNWYFLFFYCILPCLKSFQLFFGATIFFLLGAPHFPTQPLWVYDYPGAYRSVKTRGGFLYVTSLAFVVKQMAVYQRNLLKNEGLLSGIERWKNSHCRQGCWLVTTGGWYDIFRRFKIPLPKPTGGHPQGHPKLKPFQHSGFWDVMNWAAPFSYAFEQFEVLQFLKFPNSALVFLFGLVSSSPGCRAEDKNKKQQRFPWWGPIHWCDWSKPS